MDIVLQLHSVIRWVIVGVAVVASIKFALGWWRQAQVQPLDRGLISGFAFLMDLQAALGVLLLVVTGLAGAGFPMYRLEHGFTMIVATVIAHLPMRWRAADHAIALRNNLFVVVAVLALVFLGVASLPGGWSR